jgi:hypothetical protein
VPGRRYTSLKTAATVLVFLGWLLLPITVGALPAPAHDSVRSRVAAAVVRDLRLEAPLETVQSDVQVLTAFDSLPSASNLRVTAVRPTAVAYLWLLRLECTPSRECLPFYATLAGRDLKVASERGQQQAPEMLASRDLRGGWVSSPRPDPKLLLAQRGDIVLVVEERSGIRLSASAVCLQGGALGDRIRVRNLATQRVLLGVVVSRQLVRVE